MRNYALIVGINEYPDEAGQDELGGAVADAADFADWALDPPGGDVAPGDLFLWTYPAAKNVTPRVAAILKAPSQWKLMAGSVAPQKVRGPVAQEIVATAYGEGKKLQALAGEGNPIASRIYVFLAGHGVRAQETVGGASQTCFLAADFSSPNGQTAFGLVPTQSFRDGLLTGGFDEVVMFLDCCRVQDPITRLQAITICGAKKDTPAKASWTYANATLDGGVALEIEVPPTRGAFSHVLLEGLRTVRDLDDTLCAEQLKTFVVDRIATRDRGQTPSVAYNPDKAPGMVVARGPVAAAAGPPAILLNFANVPPGTVYRLLDHRMQPIAAHDHIVAIAGIVPIPAMAPGLYGVQRVDQSVPLQSFAHPGSPLDVE